MKTALKLAHEYGVDVQFADLGDWGVDELRSEYDPTGPIIRINIRVAEQLGAMELGDFICFAVGHELYHHREHIGEIETFIDRKKREDSANEFARKLLTPP